MITLGLTGAIASGKSEVARRLEARGAFRVDADRVAQETYAAIVQKQAAAGTGVLVLEAAVLLQAGWDRLVDEVWLVRAPLAVARTRPPRRPGLTPGGG